MLVLDKQKKSLHIFPIIIIRQFTHLTNFKLYDMILLIIMVLYHINIVHFITNNVSILIKIFSDFMVVYLQQVDIAIPINHIIIIHPEHH